MKRFISRFLVLVGRVSASSKRGWAFSKGGLGAFPRVKFKREWTRRVYLYLIVKTGTKAELMWRKSGEIAGDRGLSIT
ncbi:hypothetical protein MOMUL_27380 [Moorella mulderi DSM 14980]|uniref:Uncharacterized protein n=1 Tax=Moorella mulderi DSM 14980 TaxID=1122241 RepID=A0A151ATG1_9FIRM|nr:hypothetical protein MOMUL_27380 [Moorella mulderi DSM 14980]